MFYIQEWCRLEGMQIWIFQMSELPQNVSGGPSTTLSGPQLPPLVRPNVDLEPVYSIINFRADMVGPI